MANVAPAKVTITSTTGPGQTVTAQVFTDVVDVEVDFVKNTLAITRSGAGSTIYYDYSAIATVTWTIASGAATIAFS